MSARDAAGFGSSAESVELLSKGRTSPSSPSYAKAAPVPFKGRWLTPEYLLYTAVSNSSNYALQTLAHTRSLAMAQFEFEFL